MTQTVILRGLEQRALAANLIRVAPQDAVVTIREGTRTLDQNSLMWPLLSDLSRAKPEGRVMTSDNWKAACMSALGHEILWMQGIEDNPPFPAGFRSSRLTKRQMSDLIEFIYAYGSRHGVQWSGA